MIRRFTGMYTRLLANSARCPIVYDGWTYPSVLHALNASRTLDLRLRQRIQHESDAFQTSHVFGGLPARPGWERLRPVILEALLRQKFSKDPFRQTLIDTGGQLFATKDIELNRILEKIRFELQDPVGIPENVYG